MSQITYIMCVWIKCDPLFIFKGCRQGWMKKPEDRVTSKFTSKIYMLWLTYNRPFPSSLLPLFRNKSKCETIHMKMSSTCSFIFMQIKVIFIRMVSHLDSIWNRHKGTRKWLLNSTLSRGSSKTGVFSSICCRNWDKLCQHAPEWS